MLSPLHVSLPSPRLHSHSHCLTHPVPQHWLNGPSHHTLAHAVALSPAQIPLPSSICRENTHSSQLESYIISESILTCSLLPLWHVLVLPESSVTPLCVCPVWCKHGFVFVTPTRQRARWRERRDPVGLVKSTTWHCVWPHRYLQRDWNEEGSGREKTGREGEQGGERQGKKGRPLFMLKMMRLHGLV